MRRFFSIAASIVLVLFSTVALVAQEKEPQTAEEYVNRGIARSKKGDLDGAIADYDKAIALKPDYAYAYNNRGNARGKKGDDDGAIADFTKAISLIPNFGAAYANRGLAELSKGLEAEAEQDFKKAIELSASLKSMIDREAGEIRQRRKAQPKP